MKQGKVRQRFPVRTKAASDPCNTTEWQAIPEREPNPNAKKPNPVHARVGYTLDGKPDRRKEHAHRAIGR